MPIKECEFAWRYSSPSVLQELQTHLLRAPPATSYTNLRSLDISGCLLPASQLLLIQHTPNLTHLNLDVNAFLGRCHEAKCPVIIVNGRERRHDNPQLVTLSRPFLDSDIDGALRDLGFVLV